MKLSPQLEISTSTQAGRAAAAHKSGFIEAIKAGTIDRPVMVSLGMGVDSVAMTIALIQLGCIPDLIAFSDVGAEKPETIAYIDTFNKWLAQFGVQITVMRYTPVTAPYDSLYGEVTTNNILPGVALGVASCSVKWKSEAINQWLRGVPAKGRRPAQPGWAPAIECWSRGERIYKLIGFDAGAKDKRRPGVEGDSLSENIYLLRELGMNRLDCAKLILSVGLPLPVKSSCFFCSASKVEELIWLHHHHPDLFRKALVLETNALPKLRNSEGLWRKTRKKDQRPGNWKQWALQEGLIVHNLDDPDGFQLLPQDNPPMFYPDDEIASLRAQEADILKAA